MESIVETYGDNAWWKNESPKPDEITSKIWYYDDGRKKEERWYKNDKYHRENGKPVIIR